ncbi:MAG: hypothetical protein M0R80_01615 [Proteobacteria bacterium]|jgi:hypothetical protein|nr:hypothetical protein [Pseudomonadota bacterium]
MPEAFNAQVGAIGSGKDNKGRVRPRFEKRITFKMLTDWINEQNYDEYTKRELIKKASAYPYNAMKYFADNINQQVIKVREEREKLRKEKDERERMSMSVPMQESNEGSVAAELPGVECIDEGPVPEIGNAGSEGVQYQPLPYPEGKETGDGEPLAGPLPS